MKQKSPRYLCSLPTIWAKSRNTKTTTRNTKKGRITLNQCQASNRGSGFYPGHIQWNLVYGIDKNESQLIKYEVVIKIEIVHIKRPKITLMCQKRKKMNSLEERREEKSSWALKLSRESVSKRSLLGSESNQDKTVLKFIGKPLSESCVWIKSHGFIKHWEISFCTPSL